jgi:hypothetical protein
VTGAIDNVVAELEMLPAAFVTTTSYPPTSFAAVDVIVNDALVPPEIGVPFFLHW